MAEKKILVRQVKSAIGRDRATRKRLAALGLGRIGKEQVFNLTPALKGMIYAVRHVLTVSEVN